MSVSLVERVGSLGARTALVLGSGLGDLVDEVDNAVRIPYGELRVYQQSGVIGHAGTLDAADRAGVPCYLENSNPANTGFYRSRGFERMKLFEPRPGAPPMEAMWREPCAPETL